MSGVIAFGVKEDLVATHYRRVGDHSFVLMICLCCSVFAVALVHRIRIPDPLQRVEFFDYYSHRSHARVALIMVHSMTSDTKTEHRM